MISLLELPQNSSTRNINKANPKLIQRVLLAEEDNATVNTRIMINDFVTDILLMSVASILPLCTYRWPRLNCDRP